MPFVRLKIFNVIDLNSILHRFYVERSKLSKQPHHLHSNRSATVVVMLLVERAYGAKDNEDAYETSIESQRMPSVQFEWLKVRFIFFDSCGSVCVAYPIFSFNSICVRDERTPETMRKRDLPNGSHRNDRTWCNSKGNDFNSKNRLIFFFCSVLSSTSSSYVWTEQTTERNSLVSLLFRRLQKSLFIGCSCI